MGVHWYTEIVVRSRVFNCIDCGALTERRVRADRKLVCLECGIARAVAHNVAEHEERMARKLAPWLRQQQLMRDNQ